jgi:hypothetical protein
MLEKLEMKYGWKELEIGNNFPYRKFSRFQMELELKIRELVSVEIHWKILELWILTNFGQQAPGYTLLQGKINFHQKRTRN